MRLVDLVVVVVLVVAGLTLAGGAAQGGTVVITTEDGGGADGYVFTYVPDQNFGSDELLVINRFPRADYNRKIWLRFDLDALSAAPTDATLSLIYLTSSGEVNPRYYSVYGLNDGHSGESWSESSITWNNAPGNDTGSAAGLIAAQTTYLGQMVLDRTRTSAGDAITFGSAALASFLAADTDGQVTLILTRVVENDGVEEAYASKEHLIHGAPQLSITTGAQVVPTPAALPAGLALGVLGLVRATLRRKRR